MLERQNNQKNMKNKWCACYHVRRKEYICYGSPDEKETIELKSKMACVQLQGVVYFLHMDEAFS